MRLSKKTIGYMVMLSIIATVWSCKSAPVVGTLTAYYAIEDFDIFRKGQLICDSNDPFNTMTELDEEYYQIENIFAGKDSVTKIPKSKIEKKVFTMNELSTSSINKGDVFRTEKGCEARLFLSDINGHKYFFDELGMSEDAEETAKHAKCYVLSAQLYDWSLGKYLFEEQLPENDGYIGFYGELPDLSDLEVPEDYKKKRGTVGYIREVWMNGADWEDNVTAYDSDGKLLSDQRAFTRLFTYISIAYIAELDALYINGDLYYRNLEVTIQEPDYEQLVKEQLPSVETFVNVVNFFQKGTKQFLPTDQVWDNAETDIKTELGAKGFKVKRDKKRVFFISAAKNCEFKADEVDYVYSYSIKPLSSDSIAAACYFEPMGDFYVKGVILLDDPNVYEAYVEQIKEFGYKQTKEEMSESDPKEKYVKDNYYFICDKEKKIIELHYDFMKAQNIGG